MAYVQKRETPRNRRMFFYTRKARQGFMSPTQAMNALRRIERSYTLGEISYGEYSGWKKRLKKLASPLSKIGQKLTAKGPLKGLKMGLRKVATVAAVGTGGGLIFKGKVFGIKSKKNLALFKKVQKFGRVIAVVAAGVVLAPLVGPALASAASSVGSAIGSAGSAVMGGLKFAGGKLMSAPTKLLSFLSSKGIDPKTATPEQVIQAGIETGDVTPTMLENYATQYAEATGNAPSGYPTNPMPDDIAERVKEGGEVAEGGMFPVITPTTAMLVAGSIVGLMLLKKGR